MDFDTETMPLPEVTRVEVIDENGRSYSKTNIPKNTVEISFQDDLQTMKIFIR